MKVRIFCEIVPIERQRGTEVKFVDVTDLNWIKLLGDYAGLRLGSRTHLISASVTNLIERLEAGSSGDTLALQSYDIIASRLRIHCT